MKNEIVSVIIPTYNRTPSILARCIKSVKEQSYENIEIVVVDDNANLPKIRNKISSYIVSLNDPSILYIKNKQNLGGALSRNEGIKLSKGDFITFLDDDDIYLSSKVTNQVKCIKNSNADLIFGNLIIKDEREKIIDHRKFDIKDNSNNYLLKQHLLKHLTGTPTFMFRREKLLEIGMFTDISMGQEYILMLKAIINNLSIHYNNNSDVVAYFHNGERISNGKNKIDGEKYMYKIKKKYWGILSYREKNIVKSRHFLVISSVYLRSYNLIRGLSCLCVSFILSPIFFIKTGLNYIDHFVNGL